MVMVSPRENLELVIDTNIADAHRYKDVTKLYERLRAQRVFKNITFTFTTALLMEQCHFINNDYFIQCISRSDKPIPGADEHVVRFLRDFGHDGKNELAPDYSMRQVSIMKTARTDLDRQIVEVIRTQAQQVWNEWLYSDGAQHHGIMSRLLGDDYRLTSEKVHLGKWSWTFTPEGKLSSDVSMRGYMQYLCELLRWDKPQFIPIAPRVLDQDDVLQAMMMVPQFRHILAENEEMQQLRADCGEYTIRDYYMKLSAEYKANTAVIFVSEDVKARELMKEQRQKYGHTVFSLTGHDFGQTLKMMGLDVEVPKRRQVDRTIAQLKKDLKNNSRKQLNTLARPERVAALQKNEKIFQANLEEEQAYNKWQLRCVEILEYGYFRD